MDQQEKPAKFLYLPQAKNDHFIIGGADDRPDASVPGSEPEPGPEEPTGIYPCPCCGYLTFPAPKEEAIACICPVCFWENDVFDPGEDDPSDENRGLTLRQGRENYRRWGAVRPDLVVHARNAGLPAYGSSWNWDSSLERESPRSRPSVKAWQAWKEAKISMLSVRWKSRSWSA